MKPNTLRKYATMAIAVAALTDLTAESQLPESGILFAIDDTDGLFMCLSVVAGVPVITPISGNGALLFPARAKAMVFAMAAGAGQDLENVFDATAEVAALIALGYNYAEVRFNLHGVLVAATAVAENGNLGYFTYSPVAGLPVGGDFRRVNLGATAAGANIEQSFDGTLMVKLSDWADYNKMGFDNQMGCAVSSLAFNSVVRSIQGLRA